MVFSLAVHNNTQEKLHISLAAEWNRQGYTFPWWCNITPKEMINSFAVGFGHSRKSWTLKEMIRV